MNYILFAIYTLLSVLVSIRLFKLALTQQKFYEPTLKPFERLQEQYINWERLSVVLLLLFMLLVGFVIWFLTIYLAGFFITATPADIYLLTPNSAFWGIPAVFLSIIVAVAPVHYLYLFLLGPNRYCEYTEYIDLKHNMNGWGMFSWLAAVVVPICLVFIGLGLESYTRFTEHHIIVNDWLSVGEKEYAYSDIESVTLVKSFKSLNDNIVRRPHFVLNFRSGEFYNFDKTSSQPDFEEQQKVMALIKQRATFEIVEEDPYPGS